MRKRLLFLLAAAAAVTTAVVATVIPTASVSAQPPAVQWGACPQEVAGPVLQCASLGVPLDYRNPGGRQIDVMVSKMASKNPDKRRGTLFLNADGPGIAALDYGVVLASAGLPQEILDLSVIGGWCRRPAWPLAIVRSRGGRAVWPALTR